LLVLVVALGLVVAFAGTCVIVLVLYCCGGGGRGGGGRLSLGQKGTYVTGEPPSPSPPSVLEARRLLLLPGDEKWQPANSAGLSAAVGMMDCGGSGMSGESAETTAPSLSNNMNNNDSSDLPLLHTSTFATDNYVAPPIAATNFKDFKVILKF
jgi:hypothetical protein